MSDRRREYPDPDMKLPCGWILPDGSYYGCDWAGHKVLAWRIFMDAGRTTDVDPEGKAEEEGWIRVQSSPGGAKHVHHVNEWRDYPELHVRVTPEQERTLLFWCEKHDVRYPEWLIPA